jgi:D-inositol-3-phosphate glycosyltransferase
MHTSPLHQPGSGDAGGMNVYIVNTARELARLGVSVDIFTRSDTVEQAGVVDLFPGVRVVSLPLAMGVAKNGLPAHAEEFAAAILDEYGPYDVVHGHYWISGLAGRILADAWSAPLILTMHTLALVKDRGRTPGERPEPSERAGAERRLLDSADRIIVNTRSEQTDLMALYGVSPEAIDVISPGVDLETFSLDGPAAQRAHVPEGAFHVLFAGRIQRLKGPQVLVEAIARIPQSVPVHLSLVGAQSGVTELDLPALIEELGLQSRVTIHPPVTAPELAEWYRSADAVAMPSYAESFGLVALEAQACGTPVLAADVGGLPQAVSDGRTGLLISSHSPDHWAEAMMRLAQNPGLRRSMSYAAPIHARAFGWQRTAMFTVQSYRLAHDEFPRRKGHA